MATPLAAASAYASRSARRIRLEFSHACTSTGGPGRRRFELCLSAQGCNQLGCRDGPQVDAQTRAAATGKANIVDVVTAVSETEVAIDAVASYPCLYP